MQNLRSQSLFYWIIYSYEGRQMTIRHNLGGLNPYFIGLSTLIIFCYTYRSVNVEVSILILLDYLLLYLHSEPYCLDPISSQSLFYWIIYSYNIKKKSNITANGKSQSLFYWIIYSYSVSECIFIISSAGLNPYFIGLSTLII